MFAQKHTATKTQLNWALRYWEFLWGQKESEVDPKMSLKQIALIILIISFPVLIVGCIAYVFALLGFEDSSRFIGGAAFSVFLLIYWISLAFGKELKEGTISNSKEDRFQMHLDHTYEYFENNELTESKESFRKAKIYGEIPTRYLVAYRKSENS